MSIRQCREKAQMRQADVATALSVDRTAVVKWETGESLPRADKLLLLAKILGCTVEELLTGEK